MVDWRDWSSRHSNSRSAPDRDVVHILPTVQPMQELELNSTIMDVVREVFTILNNAARRCIEDVVPCPSGLATDIAQCNGKGPLDTAGLRVSPPGNSEEIEAATLTATLSSQGTTSQEPWDFLLRAPGQRWLSYDEFLDAVRKAPLAVPASELPDRTLQRFADALARGAHRSIQTKLVSAILSQPSAQAACTLLLTKRLPAPAPQREPAAAPSEPEPPLSSRPLQLGFFWKERHPDVFPLSRTHR
jgi:hypothetical protein